MGINQKEMNTGYQRDVYVPMLTALANVHNSWDRTTEVSTNGWMDKDVYTHTMDYHSAMWKKEILPFATRMDLEVVS